MRMGTVSIKYGQLGFNANLLSAYGKVVNGKEIGYSRKPAVVIFWSYLQPPLTIYFIKPSKPN